MWRRAVVSVQCTKHWDKIYSKNVKFNEASAYTGVKADVVFSLNTTGNERGV